MVDVSFHHTSRHNPTTRASITPFCPLHLHYRRLFSHLPGLFFLLFFPLSLSLLLSLSFLTNCDSCAQFFFPSLSIVGSICEFQMLLTCLFTGKSVHLSFYYLVPVSDWSTTETFRCLPLDYKYILIILNDYLSPLLDMFCNGFLIEDDIAAGG